MLMHCNKKNYVQIKKKQKNGTLYKKIHKENVLYQSLLYVIFRAVNLTAII